MNIRTKFLFTSLAITLLLGATALAGVLVSTRLLEREVEGKYQAVASYAMEKVHRLFARRFDDLALLAAKPQLLQDPPDPGRVSQLLRGYREHFRSYAPYTRLSYFDRHRRAIASGEGPPLEQREVNALWGRLARGGSYALAVAPAAASGPGRFLLADAVRNPSGAVTGMVVGEIPVAALRLIADRPLNLFHLDQPPDLTLLDRSGRVLYASSDHGHFVDGVWPGFGQVRKDLAAGEDSGSLLLRTPSPGGGDDIVIFAREARDSGYRGHGWTLTMTVPVRLALAAMTGLRNRLLLAILLIGALSAAAAIFLSKTLTRPIALLSTAAAAVGEGRLDVSVPVTSRDEAGRLAENFNAMVRQLNELNRELQVAASVDKLTGAANRSRIEQVLEAELERAVRYEAPLAVILFDLDHFKQVNDRYGHLAGDMALKTVAAVVGQIIRTNDTLGRWGGEEFLLLAPETTLAQATRLAEKIRRSVACCPIEGMEPVTISCGVTALHQGDREVDLIKRADDALYGAKRQGRNRVETAAGS